MGYVATWAGLVAAPSGVVALLLSPIAGRFMGRIDARMTASFAIVAFAISYFMRARYTPDADFLTFMWPMLVQGVSMSVFFIALVVIVLADVPPEKTPAAAGLSNFCRYTAGSFAASITTTLWDRREALHQTRIAESVLAVPGAPGLSPLQSLYALGNTAVRQAYAMSSLDFFWISGWLMLAMIPLVWLTRRPGAAGGAAAAAD